MNNQQIPWSRLSGWYNRGNVILEKVQLLESGDKESQLKHFQSIYNDIEHQNGIIYVTPFIVNELILLLNRKQTLISEKINQGLKQIKEIVDFHMENIPKEDLLALKDEHINFVFLCQEQFLFPPYINPDEEETLWLDLEEDQEHWLVTYIMTRIILSHL